MRELILTLREVDGEAAGDAAEAARTGEGRTPECEGGEGEPNLRRRLTVCASRWPSRSGPSSSAASVVSPSPSAPRQSRTGGGRGP